MRAVSPLPVPLAASSVEMEVAMDRRTSQIDIKYDATDLIRNCEQDVSNARVITVLYFSMCALFSAIVYFILQGRPVTTFFGQFDEMFYPNAITCLQLLCILCLQYVAYIGAPKRVDNALLVSNDPKRLGGVESEVSVTLVTIRPTRAIIREMASDSETMMNKQDDEDILKRFRLPPIEWKQEYTVFCNAPPALAERIKAESAFSSNPVPWQHKNLYPPLLIENYE
jgi:hypothetical protein